MRTVEKVVSLSFRESPKFQIRGSLWLFCVSKFQERPGVVTLESHRAASKVLDILLPLRGLYKNGVPRGGGFAFKLAVEVFGVIVAVRQ